MFKFLKSKTIPLYTPVDGIQIPLKEVNDPVFSTNMIGTGVAFQMEGDTVYSPCEGTLHLVADTNHAFGIMMPSGIDILIHVGLETVHLQGKGLHPLLKQGALVYPGMPLLRIDQAFMIQEKIDLTIIMVVVKDNGMKLTMKKNQKVTKGISEVITFE